MEKNTNILMVGVGGQGIILASDITALSAGLQGFDVKKSEIHGMSQRGGSVFSHIRFGKKVYSSVISHKGADVLISMELMETARWSKWVNPDTKLIVLDTKILPSSVKSYPTDVEGSLKEHFKNLYLISEKEALEKIGHIKFINIFVLGILSKFLKIKTKFWEEAIRQTVPEKSIEQNLEAFHLGAKYDIQQKI